MAGFDKRGENRGTHSGLVSETAVINGKEVKMSEWQPKGMKRVEDFDDSQLAILEQEDVPKSHESNIMIGDEDIFQVDPMSNQMKLEKDIQYL